jgi:hypothetical protein
VRSAPALHDAPTNSPCQRFSLTLNSFVADRPLRLLLELDAGHAAEDGRPCDRNGPAALGLGAEERDDVVGHERSQKGLASLGLDEAIRLRCALRDIKAKRLELSPVDPSDLRTLVNMGYVEMQDDVPRSHIFRGRGNGARRLAGKHQLMRRYLADANPAAGALDDLPSQP